MHVFLEAPVSLFLLLANVMVSGFALLSDPGLIDRLAFRPFLIAQRREVWRFVTAGFVHAGPAHLLFNVFTLYFFGPFLEGVLGPVRFLIVYFGAELAAHGLTYLRHRHDPRYSAVGASGAIAGVVFAFCLFRPFELLYVFFALPIPAWLFAVAFLAISVMAIRGQVPSGGIAHDAHLGGAIGGVLFTVLVEPRSVTVFLNHLGF